MAQQVGRQSLQFENPPWIISSGCIAGTKEGEGPIGHEIDLIGEDDNFGCDIWEEAESTLQKEALTLALGKAGLKAEELRYLFAGDLLGPVHGDILSDCNLLKYRCLACTEHAPPPGNHWR